VRQGNPKSIRDWPDLVQRDGLRVIAANPKIGGAAKLSYIAAWGATKRLAGDAAADHFVKQLYNPTRIPTLESSSRTATQTFARKQIGDVHVTWESEAILELRELADHIEIVRPSQSVLAEPHVAVVNVNARRHGTEAIAADYVRFLYTPESQKLIASLGFRPTVEEVRRETLADFDRMDLFRVGDVLTGGWAEAQQRFFDDGGLFDQSYR
jgi:sulfate transport system substrate-binding protein